MTTTTRTLLVGLLVSCMLCIMPAGCTSAPTAPPTTGEIKQFYRACESGDLKTVKELLDTRANAQLIDATLAKYGDSPLHWAVDNKHLDIVKLLIEHGADVNVSDELGMTPVHLAASNGSAEIAKLLVDNGADIMARTTVDPLSISAGLSRYGDTPLHWAANYEVGLILIDKGADVNAIGEDNKTPLHHAAQLGTPELVRLLLTKGSKASAKDRMGRTPMDIVCEFSGDGDYHMGSHIATLKAGFLVANGANVNQDFIEENGVYRPLSQAALQPGNLELVKFLVGKGANVNPPCSKYGDLTPLAAAAQVEGNKEVVKFLLDKGAKVNAISHCDGRFTPLDVAVDDDIKKILVQHGAKPSGSE